MSKKYDDLKKDIFDLKRKLDKIDFVHSLILSIVITVLMVLPFILFFIFTTSFDINIMGIANQIAFFVGVITTSVLPLFLGMTLIIWIWD